MSAVRRSGADPAVPDDARPGSDEVGFLDLAAQRLPAECDAVDLRANRLFLRLQRTSSAIFYDFDSSIHRPADSSWATFRILFCLWVAGPQGVNGLGKTAGMSRAAASSLVRGLVERGDLRKDDDPADRRAVVVSLTPQGLERIRDAFNRQHERERQWAALLTPAEQEVLGMLLDKLMAGSREVEAHERT